MIIKRLTKESYPLDLTKPRDTKELLYVWGCDGWCYISELKKRVKFLITNNNDLIMTEEQWEGVLPLPQFVEKIQMTLISESPRVWMEESPSFCEIYVEQLTTQNKNKKSRGRQVGPQ